jgi:hypothetical protein
MTRQYEIHVTRLLGIAILASLGFALPAHAFSPLSTDDTGTLGQSRAEIELGYNFDRNLSLDTEEDDRVDTREFSRSIPMTFTYGITDRMNISLGLSRQLSNPSGWQNSELGLKWNFYGDASEGWSAAIKPVVILPVTSSMQNKGLGSAKTNWGLTLIGSYVNKDYEFHANLKYTSNYQANNPEWEFERNHLWSASVSPVLVLNDQWKVGLDLGLRTNPGFSSATEAFTQFGVSYAPLENLQIGLGIGTAHAVGSETRDRGLSIATTLAYQF